MLLIDVAEVIGSDLAITKTDAIQLREKIIKHRRSREIVVSFIGITFLTPIFLFHCFDELDKEYPHISEKLVILEGIEFIQKLTKYNT